MNPNSNKTLTAANESISALLDNEADELDLRRVLKESTNGDLVRATWRRYHLTSAVLRKEGSSFVGVDISALVRAEIDLESAHSVRRPYRRWMDVVAKTSIAATVAVGLLVGVQQYSSVGGGTGGVNGTLVDTAPFLAPDLNSAVVPAGFDSPRLQARTVSTGPKQPGVSLSGGVKAIPEQNSDRSVVSDPALQEQFSRLMMIHAQQVSEHTDLGVMSFARLTDLHALDESSVSAEEPRLEPDAP